MTLELGKSEAEACFHLWAGRICEVCNEWLLVTVNIVYPYVLYTSRNKPWNQDRSMVAQAVGLQFDHVPSQNIADIQRAFLDDCATANNYIQAGEFGLEYLWNTLADLDRSDIVLELARQEEDPSYMRGLQSAHVVG